MNTAQLTNLDLRNFGGERTAANFSSSRVAHLPSQSNLNQEIIEPLCSVVSGRHTTHSYRNTDRNQIDFDVEEMPVYYDQSKTEAFNENGDNRGNFFEGEPNLMRSVHRRVTMANGSRDELNGLLLSPDSPQRRETGEYLDHRVNYFDSDPNFEQSAHPQQKLTAKPDPALQVVQECGPHARGEPNNNESKTDSCTSDAVYYMSLYESEKQKSSERDKKILSLEGQIKTLKGEKMTIIKNYERLIKKMVLVKEIEKEYAKISVVHLSATEELNKLKVRVEQFRDTKESIISTERADVEPLPAECNNNLDNREVESSSTQILDSKQLSHMTHNLTKDNSSKVSNQSQARAVSPRNNQHKIFSRVSKADVIETSALRREPVENKSELGSSRKVRSISLSNNRNQRTVDLSCDQYLERFGKGVKKITVNGKVLYEKYEKFGMNGEYFEPKGDVAARKS